MAPGPGANPAREGIRFQVSEMSAQEMALRLKRGAIDMFKQSMHSQLEMYQTYLDKLFQAI